MKTYRTSRNAAGSLQQKSQTPYRSSPSISPIRSYGCPTHVIKPAGQEEPLMRTTMTCHCETKRSREIQTSPKTRRSQGMTYQILYASQRRATQSAPARFSSQPENASINRSKHEKSSTIPPYLLSATRNKEAVRV